MISFSRFTVSLAIALVCQIKVAAAQSMHFEDEQLNKLFKACQQCHGDGFEGKIQRRAPRLAGMETWYITRQLQNFRDGIRGSHVQDGYGMQMAFVATKFQSDAQIQMISQRISDFEPMGPASDGLQENTGGRPLYTPCAVCHGDKAEGNKNLGAPALAGQSAWYLAVQLRNFRDRIRGVHALDIHGRQMSAMISQEYSDQVIDELAQYIGGL